MPKMPKGSIMKEKTKRNLQEAFLAEAKAHFRLLLYSLRAQQEGLPALARLLKAVANSEAVHARNALSILEEVGTTQQNLRASFEREQFVSSVAYPRMLREAWAENEPDAVWVFTKARNVEERHAKLYKMALSDVIMDRIPEFFVCSRCGWIENSRPQERCQNCEGPPEDYTEVK
jgi:rubrerythrin